jgi:hypothetical protein
MDFKKLKEHRNKNGLSETLSLYRQYWQQIFEERYKNKNEK